MVKIIGQEEKEPEDIDIDDDDEKTKKKGVKIISSEETERVASPEPMIEAEIIDEPVIMEEPVFEPEPIPTAPSSEPIYEEPIPEPVFETPELIEEEAPGPMIESTPSEAKQTGMTTLDDVILSLENKGPLAIDAKRVHRAMIVIMEKYHDLRPGFSYSWVTPEPPENSKKILEYKVQDALVSLWLIKDFTYSHYHIKPKEYSLPSDLMKLIHLAKIELLRNRPRHIQLDRPGQARLYVENFGKKILYQIANKHSIKIGNTPEEEMKVLDDLTSVLARYTVGLGLFEYFLEDPYMQDIYVDAPAPKNPIHASMGGLANKELYDKFVTNVILSNEDVDSMVSRFRYESGRPFSEAMPVLETDLVQHQTRVTAIGKPLSPDGIGIAFRRHSTDPWTMLKLIDNGTVSPLSAGLLSFLIEGHCTMLVSGSRGAGKSSLLGSLLLEFPTIQRILTIEDTLELPVPEMQKLGYKVQRMFVQSTLGGKGEMTADDALRTSLRLGESALILGEVRGQEARTLYEAMRTGTAGSSVMGTFHADSAKSTFERATSDMGIPATSFMATDIIVVQTLTQSKGSQKLLRRCTQIAETAKTSDVPGEFNDLMMYDSDNDLLMETDVFNYKSERIGEIARKWGISMEDALNDIRVRARYRLDAVEYAREHDKPQLLKIEWVARMNNKYWALRESAISDGDLNFNKILEQWRKWFLEGAKYA